MEKAILWWGGGHGGTRVDGMQLLYTSEWSGDETPDGKEGGPQKKKYVKNKKRRTTRRIKKEVGRPIGKSWFEIVGLDGGKGP